MKCGGCDVSLSDPQVFAIMARVDIDAAGLEIAKEGPGKFHAVAVCGPCHRDPSKRKRNLKAHFAEKPQLFTMLGLAGSGGSVGA